jgi:hypothetical protein
MSVRRVKIVLLCEDSQQEAFVRRFLEHSGWNTREIRVEKSPKAGGSAEQFVRNRFPAELTSFRRRNQRAASALITVIDADLKSVQERVNELETECNSQNVEFRTYREPVAIVIPKRNIETWIHYLDREQVDETREYPKLDRPGSCSNSVSYLVSLCRTAGLPKDAPSSLIHSCLEYNKRIKPLSE